MASSAARKPASSGGLARAASGARMAPRTAMGMASSQACTRRVRGTKPMAQNPPARHAYEARPIPAMATATSGGIAIAPRADQAAREAAGQDVPVSRGDLLAGDRGERGHRQRPDVAPAAPQGHRGGGAERGHHEVEAEAPRRPEELAEGVPQPAR